MRNPKNTGQDDLPKRKRDTGKHLDVLCYLIKADIYGENVVDAAKKTGLTENKILRNLNKLKDLGFVKTRYVPPMFPRRSLAKETTRRKGRERRIFLTKQAKDFAERRPVLKLRVKRTCRE